MARLANGVYTGQLDSKLGSIRVGDTVRCLADGIEYVVDGYSGIRNASALFRVSQWDPSQFLIVQGTVPASSPVAQTGGAPAQVNEEFEESIEAAERSLAAAATAPDPAPDSNPLLGYYSAKELAAELTRRGFVGVLERHETLTVGE